MNHSKNSRNFIAWRRIKKNMLITGGCGCGGGATEGERRFECSVSELASSVGRRRIVVESGSDGGCDGGRSCGRVESTGSALMMRLRVELHQTGRRHSVRRWIEQLRSDSVCCLNCITSNKNFISFFFYSLRKDTIKWTRTGTFVEASDARTSM